LGGADRLVSVIVPGGCDAVAVAPGQGQLGACVAVGAAVAARLSKITSSMACRALSMPAVPSDTSS
jgi:hypothetical protein